MPSSEEKLYAALIHGFAALGFPFIAPLVGYLALQQSHPFAFRQAKEGLNFQITTVAVSIVLAISVVGIPVLFVYLPVVWVFQIFAAIQVFQGREYRFPLTYRIIK